MSLSVVLDASVPGGWLLNEARSSQLMDSLLSKFASGYIDFIVPGLFFDEVLNVLLKGINTGRIDDASYGLALNQLYDLHGIVEIFGSSVLLGPVIEKESLARKHNFRSYDTNYLLLAMETNSRIVSLDDRLIRTSKSEGCYYE